MEKKDVTVLKDMQGFIQFCLDEDMGLSYCLGNLGHDINGIIFEKHGFSPRTSGYAKQLKK